MAFFDNGNVKIYYEVHGESGPLVVLINGHTRSCSDFKQLCRFLESHSYQVLTFDNRGAGQTEINSLDFSLEEIGKDLEALLVHLNFGQAHVVGFSMGGIIARIFAHQSPKRLLSLSLISSPASLSSFSKLSSQPWGDSGRAVFEKLSHYVAQDFLEKNKILIEAMSKGIVKEISGDFLERSRCQREATLMTPETFFSIKALNCPIFLLHGEEDEVIPVVSVSELQSQNALAKKHVFKDSGHLLLLEKGKDLYEKVLFFLDSCD